VGWVGEDSQRLLEDIIDVCNKHDAKHTIEKKADLFIILLT